MKIKRLPMIMTLLFLLVLGGCSKTPYYVQSFAMDTLITVTVYSESDVDVANDCLSLLDDYDAQWSAYTVGSDIHTLNQEGQTVLLGDSADLLLSAMEYASVSGGAFDPSIYPITSLWHLSSRTEEEALPDAQSVQAACDLVGYKNIAIENQATGGILVRLDNGMALDMGGIAKGYAADKLKDHLENNGVEDAILSLGGSVCLIGSETYTVGLEDPRADGIFCKLELSDVYVVTSGDYQRYIDVNGQRIHHIFDPKTGYSVHNGLCSVTIIGQSGAQCDALSTAVFVLGLEEGMELVGSQELDAVLVMEDGRIYLTDGIEQAFTLVNTNYAVQ